MEDFLEIRRSRPVAFDIPDHSLVLSGLSGSCFPLSVSGSSFSANSSVHNGDVSSDSFGHISDDSFVSDVVLTEDSKDPSGGLRGGDSAGFGEDLSPELVSNSVSDFPGDSLVSHVFPDQSEGR